MFGYHYLTVNQDLQTKPIPTYYDTLASQNSSSYSSGVFKFGISYFKVFDSGIGFELGTCFNALSSFKRDPFSSSSDYLPYLPGVGKIMGKDGYSINILAKLTYTIKL